MEDIDAFRERIAAAASGLLALLGIDADPIRSREHILISKILETAWTARRDLDIAQLIREIQAPPFPRVGVMEIDAFYPPKDRAELAMSLNNLLASPSFASWMTGEPLNVANLLHTPEGKPCISIMSIAHLPEAQCMFFVTVLLNEVLAWMRVQSGTSSLRALLYMDEVFGYFPPTANPPSKPPMLTLLKQARAFGLGVILATQNPVDLDYKGLSNTGTWFLGRLQTERDKLRVLDGLEGASAQTGSNFNRAEMEVILAGLGNRIFLMNNVHEEAPVIFETRWAMSYLRGPLTRSQIQSLTASARAAKTESASISGDPRTPVPAETDPLSLKVELDGTLLIPKEVPQWYAPSKHPLDGERSVYRPALLGVAKLYFSKSTCGVDTSLTRTFLVTARGDDVADDAWTSAQQCDALGDLVNTAETDAQFAVVPASMQRSKQFADWEKQFKEFLYREQELIVWNCAELRAYSQPSETEGAFRVRLEQLASEQRDLQTEKLRKSYAPKFRTLQDRIRRAEEKIERETEQYKQKRLDSILHVGSTIIGALLGRRKFTATNIGKAATSMKSAGKAVSEHADIGRAEESREALNAQMGDLQSDFDLQIQLLADKLKVADLQLEEIHIRPKKTDITVQRFGVVWLPFRVDATGVAEPNWQ